MTVLKKKKKKSFRAELIFTILGAFAIPKKKLYANVSSNSSIVLCISLPIVRELESVNSASSSDIL